MDCTDKETTYILGYPSRVITSFLPKLVEFCFTGVNPSIWGFCVSSQSYCCCSDFFCAKQMDVQVSIGSTIAQYLGETKKKKLGILHSRELSELTTFFRFLTIN